MEERLKALEELEKAKFCFLTDISHEIRASLTPIKNPLEQITSGNTKKSLESNANRMARNEAPTSSRDREFIEKVKAEIEENFSHPKFNEEQLARKLRISQPTLRKKLAALTGEGANRMIRSYCLTRAAQMLEADFGNITEVAYAVGFSGSAYFAKCFKKKFHQAPKKYTHG